ncbi:uncharacterized protein A4U43_C01F23770 [Asparagus officinalis]|uniref:GATA-type domain-containing protein n=1 Tax=Asparagus officinalis TaxID=4686 RepID=A0A5P1FSG3_ASPOF|nr:GATA transcription factor 21-like [Asparagus officinalis]ONK80964.1 uncharacterized protein A4U43_C01F23770 [Asparagus officinalis]
MTPLEGDHDPSHFHPFTLQTHDPTSSIPYSFFLNTQQVIQEANGAHNLLHHHQQKQEFIDQVMNIQGSSNFTVSFSTNTTNSIDDIVKDEKKSSKWMSSKRRLMRKMMNPDGIITKKPRRSRHLLQDQQHHEQLAQESSSSNTNNSSSSDGVVRVCSDCNTTKTPLWRSGPSGPKSLCNACGIRQRKARRALAAAAAVSSGLIPLASRAKDRKSDHKEYSESDRNVPFKKRCRFSTAGGDSAQKQIKKKKEKRSFDDIVISLSKSSAFHRVFPQDEKDAAILLMALSCGLVCS